MNETIVYELTKVFHIYIKNMGEVEFELRIPKEFHTPQEAASAETLYCAHMRKSDDGRVFIAILEKQKKQGLKKTIDRIFWEDHRKYRCITMKKEAMGKTLIDDSDFVPCALKFSSIFDLSSACFRDSNEKALWLESAAYEVRPVFKQSVSSHIAQSKSCDDMAELASLVASHDVADCN